MIFLRRNTEKYQILYRFRGCLNSDCSDSWSVCIFFFQKRIGRHNSYVLHLPPNIVDLFVSSEKETQNESMLGEAETDQNKGTSRI